MTIFIPYRLKPPTKIQMATFGAAQTPHYMRCANCGQAKELAGFFAPADVKDPSKWTDFAMIRDGDFFKAAAYCEACWTSLGHGEVEPPDAEPEPKPNPRKVYGSLLCPVCDHRVGVQRNGRIVRHAYGSGSCRRGYYPCEGSGRKIDIEQMGL